MVIHKRAKHGTPVLKLCREHDMGDATFYKWRAAYGGIGICCMGFCLSFNFLEKTAHAGPVLEDFQLPWPQTFFFADHECSVGSEGFP